MNNHNSILRSYDSSRVDIPEYCDLFTVREWNSYTDSGAIIPDDGTGYWATETYMDRTAHAFREQPSWATHVAWFNK